jgi:small subunit ribosomal protein S16
MLVIRFLRTGKKNQPSFRIVVTDKKRAPQSGRFLEMVGFYNPLTKEKNLNKERIKHWLTLGAQPSERVYNLLIEEKIIEGKKIPLHSQKEKEKEEKLTSEPKEELKKEENK